MTDQRCETCVYWGQAGARLANAIIDPAAKPDVGVCMYNPPVMMPTAHFPVSVFPEVHASRWCGGWEPEPEDGGDGGKEEPASSNVLAFNRGAS